MKKYIIIVFAIGLLTSCASCNKTVQQKHKTNKEKISLKKEAQPSLSPGTVLAKVTVLKKQSDKVSNKLYINVEKVLGYGHSTPAIAKGEKFYVNVKSKKLFDAIHPNQSETIILKHSYPSVGEESSVEWILNQIK